MVERRVDADLVERLVLAAGKGRSLGVGRLNALVPAEFPLEQLDELFEALGQRRVSVVDEEREARVERRKQERKGQPGAGPAAPSSSSSREGSDELSASSQPPSEIRVAGLAGEETAPAEPALGLSPEEERDLVKNASRSWVGNVRRGERLSPEAEGALQARAAAGDEAARTALVEAFLPLVLALARRYRRTGVPFMELVLAGNEGLVEAAHHLPAGGREPFASTARWWIRQHLSRAVADSWELTSIPRSVARQLRRMNELASRYRITRGREPTPAVLARAMRVSLDEVLLLRTLCASPQSLSAPVGGDPEAGTLADQIVDHSAQEGARRVDEAAGRERMGALLERLPVVEREVLSLRYGLRDGVSRSLEEVAGLTGLTREDVAERERRGLDTLRRLMP